MLMCEYCDYFKPANNKIASLNSNTFICEYSNYVFPGNIEDLNIEYPCCELKDE